MNTETAVIKWRGLQNYQQCWQEMQEFTNTRTEKTLDEFWLLEHPPVFTQGQAGKPEHILAPGNIPVIKTDRGGQVTYHGPGQLILYPLIDLRRKNLSIRKFVTILENAVIAVMQDFNITATAKCEAPGVYVDEKKICSIGLRIRRGCTYHGIAFNIHMDLEPFKRINPCGFNQLEMTQLTHFSKIDSIYAVGMQLVTHLNLSLGYIATTLHTELNQGINQ